MLDGFSLAGLTFDPSVAVGGIEGKPTLVAVRMEAVDPTEGICRTAVGQHTTGELHGPYDGFIDFGKFDRVGLGFLSRDFDGFLAGQVTARLQGVNADIHQRSSTGQIGLESPLVGVPDLEAKAGIDHLQVPKGFVSSQLHAGLVMRFKLAAVTDGQFFPGIPAGFYHGHAIRGGIGHGLFTQDVLTGFGCSDGVFSVHAIGQHDVNHVDIWIVRDLVESIVIVAVLFRDLILGLPGLDFGGGAADDARQIAVLGFLQSGGNLVSAQSTQSDQRIAQAFGFLRLNPWQPER